MKLKSLTKAWLPGLVVLAGCAGASVSDHAQTAPVNDSRPAQIIVYPFATNPNEVSLNQSVFQRAYRSVSGEDSNAKQDQIADDTAHNVCLEVVTALTQKGYNATCQSRGVPPPDGNTIVVDGEFTDISEGNRLRRMVIGFGAGASVLDTNVYVNQTSPNGGQHQIMSFSTHADSGKMPGVAVTGVPGAAVGGSAAAASLGANLAAGGVKTYTSSTGYLGDKTAEQIVDSLTKYFAQQGWPA
jgi:hypothetical protein